MQYLAYFILVIYPRQKAEESDCQSTQIKKGFLLCVQDYAVFLALVSIFIDDMSNGRKNIFITFAGNTKLEKCNRGQDQYLARTLKNWRGDMRKIRCDSVRINKELYT